MPRTSSESNSSLLRSIFDGSNRGFVVLRNSDLLPAKLSGTDLDLSILPGCTVDESVATLTTIARGEGWQRVLLSTRPHMTAVAFIDTEVSNGHALHFDIFNGITAFGLPLISPQQLSRLTVTRQGVTELSKRGTVLVTVLHHLAWTGCLSKERYRRELADFISNDDDRSWLSEQMTDRFGAKVAAEVTRRGRTEELANHAIKRRVRVALGLIVKAARRQPLATGRQVAEYLGGQIDSVLHPPGIVGLKGDPVPGVPSKKLSVGLACQIAPHGFYVPNARSQGGSCQTTNGPRYESTVRSSWRRWSLIRWIFPSFYFWMCAKRGRVVVTERLPFSLLVLRRFTRRPSWLCAPPD